MPITIDITQDVRSNAGEEKGKLEGKLEGRLIDAERMIRKASMLSFVQEITELDMNTLISISNRITKEK